MLIFRNLTVVTMRIIFALLITLIGLSASAQPGRLKDYVLNVGQFDKIKIDDNVNVVYRQSADSTSLC